MINLNFDWSNSWLIATILNTFLIIIALISPKKLLTIMGYLNAWVLGVIVWGCFQWQGYLVVMFYFLVGSGITKVGIKQKEAEGIAEKRSGVRGPENVWGSALIATICALGYVFAPLSWQHFFVIGYVASFATKLSDTCASEIGKAYGKNTFLITTLKPVPRGTEGAISVEGTIAGIIASIAIALLGYGINMIDGMGIIICLISAFIATNLESLIGATLQTKFNWLTNEIVNVLNTLMGAIIAILLTYVYLVNFSL
ncbi:MAG: TIGR00297 family protein [Cyanobacteria bacterium]|nr:TIGR00297 family protein [Cyanobacteria bacterium CG_2015-16_32_12]NCO79280.1 TIGR00297 family protein [Cyanobacteria bacterium CG_2015-22_32_23]NCQ05387.1 TIGR00297 family protein [Cyanobacteria bacterium CG_2015-09_32_10]NCQ41644.1 TIGR00297 family protein [Cyanobacteria bacterium CG_2015-04_32_10]NCS85593.1 TIGR00297 family protein [Cyanobacteria bacterium CG_2015-02_32_10]